MKTNKTLILTLITIILIIPILTYLVFNIVTYNSPNKYISNVSKDSQLFTYYKTKNDFFNPILTFTYQANPCDDTNSEFAYAVIHLQKSWTGFYTKTKFAEGKAKCSDYQEFLEVIKTKDLSNPNQNPNGKKFFTQGVPVDDKSGQKDIYLDKTGEGYYNPPRGRNKHSDKLEDFKKLKVGMNYQEVIDIVGKGDIGFGSDGVSKQKGEISYTIRKNGIRFIALGWDKYPDMYEGAKLNSVWVVYEDKRAEELKIEKLR